MGKRGPKPGFVSRYQRRQNEESNDLDGQARTLPLNDLPKWTKDAISEAHDELGYDPIRLATIFTLHHRKSQTNHDETQIPDFHRQSEAIYKAAGDGQRWNDESMVRVG